MKGEVTTFILNIIYDVFFFFVKKIKYQKSNKKNNKKEELFLDLS